MKNVKGSGEAEIRVERNGTAILPASFLGALHARPGSRVRVRVQSEMLTRDLKLRGVTEEEIEAIGALQFEQRASVVSFLSSEGALCGEKAFRRKIKRSGR
jgi:hypothetical protein